MMPVLSASAKLSFALLLVCLLVLQPWCYAGNVGTSSMRSSERVTSAAMKRWHWQSSGRQGRHTSLRPPIARSVPLPSRGDTSKAIADGATEWSLSRPEGTRRFWVRLPAQYNKSADSFPVLFALHGLGDTCEDFGPATGFSALADNATRPFIYVYPCGWPGLLGNAWNAGTCCLQPTTIDDVAFARGMVAALLAGGVRVDESRVWVSGFSAGGMMSEVIGCSAADVFSASASVSGVVELEPGNEGGLAACDKQFAPLRAANRSLAVFHVHGLADDIVPFTGDALLGFPAILEDMERWVLRVGCGSANHSTLSAGPYSNVVWSNCSSPAASNITPASVSVQLVENAGGGHEWPDDANFSTQRAIVEFFFQSAQPTQQPNTTSRQ